MLVTDKRSSTMLYSEATTHALIQFAQETPAFAPLLARALRQAGITPREACSERLYHGDGYLEEPDVALLQPPHLPAAVTRLHWLLHHIQKDHGGTHQARHLLAEWLGSDEPAEAYVTSPALQPTVHEEVNPIWLFVFGLVTTRFWLINALGYRGDYDVTQNVVVCTTALTEHLATVIRAAAQVSAGVVGAVLAAENYDFSMVPPELAIWLLGDRDISLFRVTTQEDFTEIVHELDRLAVPYAVATKEGIVALAMLPAFRGSFLTIERDLEPLSYA